jgi:hypothetical protein
MEPETIKLKKPRWEQLALRIGTGTDGVVAYRELYPNCSTASKNYNRLVRMNPDILARAEQVRAAVEKRAINRAAMAREDVQESLLENIEHAKMFGKVIRDKRTGEVIALERNHQAINAALKIVADINGLSIKQIQKKARGEDDEEAMLTPEQLLKNILRKWAATKGKGLDAGTIEQLRSISDASGTRSPTGSGEPEPPEVLRPLSEAKDVSPGGSGEGVPPVHGGEPAREE